MKWLVAALALVVSFPTLADEPAKPGLANAKPSQADDKPEPVNAKPEPDSKPEPSDDKPEVDKPDDNKPAVGKLLTWHKSLAPAIEEARVRKTQILVRVGAEWCGWCRRLDKEIVRPDVQKELAGWTLVLLDADDDEAEVRRLSVGPIPALRVLNGSGRTVRSHDGYLAVEALIRWLRGQDEEPPPENAGEITEVPELTPETLAQLAGLLAHRDATVREAVARKLAANKGLAGPEVVKVFVRGKLGARLAAVDVLEVWNAPVQDLDPWQPQTITAERLAELEEWASKLSPGDGDAAKPVEPLTDEQLAEARLEIAKITAAELVEMEAIGARLSRYGERLLPVVREQRVKAATDQARERLDWLRYRLVASDALMLKWPGGLIRLASTDAKARHDAAGELPTVVSHGDESLLIELFGHPDAFVRELSLKALHGVGGQRAGSELARLLADPEPNVRAAVLKQMAEKPSAKLVPQVEEYIARETDSDLVVHAVRLLRETKCQEAVECLVTLFTHSSWQVRAEAVEAVGEIVSQLNQQRGNGQKLDPGASADAYVAVIELLKDSDGFVVSRAINALKESDLAIAAAPLAKAAEQHSELADTVATAMIGGSNLRAKSMPILRGWLKHPEESLRAAALKGLMNSGSLEGRTELVPTLSDPSEKVRVAAVTQLLQFCESQRPSKSRPKSAQAGLGADYEDDSARPTPADESVLGQAARALGSLFLPSKPVPKPASSPVKPAPRQGIEFEFALPPEAAPAESETAKPKTKGTDTKSKDDPQPFESWLIGFRSGKGRPKWMTEAVTPLKTMFESPSAEERQMAGKALIALGDDDGMLPRLMELARQDAAFVLPLAGTLRWLPWEIRLQAFNELRPLVSGPEQMAQLCDEFAFLRDVRAGEFLWDVLAQKPMDASLAHSVYVNLLHVHGVEMRYGYYIDTDQRQDPVAFDVEKVNQIAKAPENEWQRRVALALLLQFDREAALESANEMLKDKKLPASLQADAFTTMLIGTPAESAGEASVAMLAGGNPALARTAVKFLTLGRSSLHSFADEHFRLPNTVVDDSEPQLIGLAGDESTKGKSLPKGLTVDLLQPYLAGPDEELASFAAHLMALLGDSSGMDRLIAHWRHEATGHGGHAWQKLVYEAIAVGNDPRFVPVLEEIFRSTQKDYPYAIREFYWSIRSMTGPEILKLRKTIRDEVGMDQLR